MAMKRIAAMLLTLVLLLSCVGCAQDGLKEPGADSLWFAMPITELVTAVYAAACIRRYTARLDAKAT